MIYTFYSYKGGVGRTMALANVAELFCRQGMKVLMIDWDLEAPGLEQFFFSGQSLEDVRANPGIMDLLLEYKSLMTSKQDLSNSNKLPFRKPQKIAIPIERASLPGQLWLITPGQRSPEALPDYVNTILAFDWQNFYEQWQGELYFDWFRRECKKFVDLILIDSRTGMTEMGGVCTYHLADAVILFCAANNQNIQGTLDMLRNLSSDKLKEQRGGRSLKTVVVPSRIDTSADTALRTRFRHRFTEEFASLLNLGKDRLGLFDELTIPYITSYSFEEQIAVIHGKKSELYAPELNEAYGRLANFLKGLKGELQHEWDQKMTMLSKERDDYGQKLAELMKTKILNTITEEKERLSSEIEHIETERQAIDDKLDQLQQEFRYYLN